MKNYAITFFNFLNRLQEDMTGKEDIYNCEYMY